MRHKFHEIAHTSQYALGYTKGDIATSYITSGGHDNSPFENGDDIFSDKSWQEYKNAGLDKICQF